MVTIKDSYTLLGSALILTGILLAALANFILASVPLTALGISTLIIGAVALAIVRGQPKLPPEAATLLLESGVENIAALIEELGLKTKAIYLPSSKTSGKPQALIALHINPHPPKIEKTLPKRLIVKLGNNPEDMGILLTTPGSNIASTITQKPDATSADLEAALSTALAGTIDLADTIRVSINNEKIITEIINPRLQHKNMQIYESIGSPLASIVASIITQTLDKPVMVVKEEYAKGKQVIELKLVG